MTARFKFGVVFSSTLLTVMLVIGALMGKGQDRGEAYRPLEVYTEVLAKVKSDYVEEPDMSKVTQGALQGLVEYLDPLSSYLTKEQYAAFRESQSNDDGGSGMATGLIIHKRAGYATVLAVLPGSAADKAGIRPGDLVEAIEGLSTRVMPPAYLRSMLSGALESKVTVLVRSLRDSDEPEEHLLERAAVELPAVSSKIIEGDIGYLEVKALDGERLGQVREAIKSLEARGAKKLILDLRGNAVGEPEDGIRLANIFLSEGVIAKLKGQQYAEKAFEADAESRETDLPLVVITDRTTVSGAEIAAAAILDNNRGDVVGERTFGLAALQETIELEDGAALVLSIAKYQRPSGEALQDGGVTPNHPLAPEALRAYRQSQSPHVPDAPEPPITPAPDAGDSGKDPFLEKAIDVLNGEATAQKEAA